MNLRSGRRLRVVIYTRISRDDTGTFVKTQTQEKRCRALCESRGWEVVAVRNDESKSAFKPGVKREGWEAVLEMIANGEVDVVVSYHIDRMTRSMLDLEELILLAEEAGVGVATATGDIDLTTDVGRMVARILAAVARAEVERKSARQKMSNEARASRGEVHNSGPRPFGYLDDRVTAHPEESKAFIDAVNAVLTDSKTVAEIGREWQETLNSTRKTRDGDYVERVFNGPTVRKIMVNPRYMGKRTYLGEVVADAEWEPLIDEATYEALKATLNDPTRGAGNPNGNKPTTLLTGVATCAKCGAGARSMSPHGVPSYSCRNQFCFNMRRDLVDNYVIANVVDAVASGGISTKEGVDRDYVLNQIENTEKRMKSLASMFAAGELEEDEWKGGRAVAQTRLADLRRLIVVKPWEGIQELSGTPEEIAEKFLALPLTRQRAIVSTLFDVKLVGGLKKGRAKVPIELRVLVTEAA